MGSRSLRYFATKVVNTRYVAGCVAAAGTIALSGMGLRNGTPFDYHRRHGDEIRLEGRPLTINNCFQGQLYAAGRDHR